MPRREFAAHYRELALPRLRLLCVAHGSSIAHGLESFSEAAARIMRHATALGASWLAEEQLAELEDYLLTTLSVAAWDTAGRLNVLGGG